MQSSVRDHVPAVTGILTVVSLALVLAAARQLVPPSLLPTAPETVLAAIPHVNAVISVVAIATIVAGVRAIRRGAIERHRRLMLASFGLFVTFLVLYLYKVAVAGPKSFPGPSTVETFLYLPILGVHMALAVVCLPLLYYVLLLAYTRPVGALSETNHPRVGRVAAALWIVSFALGFVVYALLYLVY